MIRKIVKVKNPILRQLSKPVQKIDKKILNLIEDMQETLEAQKNPPGIALAAPQIGKNLRIFVIDYNQEKRVIINPQVLKVSKKQILPGKTMEGCLSVPKYYSPLKRAESIKLSYQTPQLKTTTKWFKGFIARIIQHELDHLNGILFVDRALEQKATLYEVSANSWEKVQLL